MEDLNGIAASSFDSIVADTSLEYTDTQKSLNEAHRVLVEGGEAAFLIYHGNSTDVRDTKEFVAFGEKIIQNNVLEIFEKIIFDRSPLSDHDFKSFQSVLDRSYDRPVAKIQIAPNSFMHEKMASELWSMVQHKKNHGYDSTLYEAARKILAPFPNHFAKFKLVMKNEPFFGNETEIRRQVQAAGFEDIQIEVVDADDGAPLYWVVKAKKNSPDGQPPASDPADEEEELINVIRTGLHSDDRMEALEKLKTENPSRDRLEALLYAFSDPHGKTRERATQVFLKQKTDNLFELLKVEFENPLVPQGNADPRYYNKKDFKPEKPPHNARLASLWTLKKLYVYNEKAPLYRLEIEEELGKISVPWIKANIEKSGRLIKENMESPLGTQDTLSIPEIFLTFALWQNELRKKEAELGESTSLSDKEIKEREKILDSLENTKHFRSSIEQILFKMPDSPTSALQFISHFQNDNLEIRSNAFDHLNTSAAWLDDPLYEVLIAGVFELVFTFLIGTTVMVHFAQGPPWVQEIGAALAGVVVRIVFHQFHRFRGDTAEQFLQDPQIKFLSNLHGLAAFLIFNPFIPVPIKILISATLILYHYRHNWLNADTEFIKQLFILIPETSGLSQKRGGGMWPWLSKRYQKVEEEKGYCRESEGAALV